MDFTKNYIFILGCERSGSTWVSNVFSAHPDVEFFMEPFADYANIFPGFPSRNLYVDICGKALAELVLAGYARLMDFKYPYTYRRGRNLLFKKIDSWIVKGLILASQITGLRVPQGVERFQLLTLNTSVMPLAFHRHASGNCNFTVTKELRLNFKIGVLKQIFPQSKCLIVIRHPGAQINSILRLMAAGRLGELNRSLVAFYEHVRNDRNLDKYQYLTELWDKKSNREKLLAWWVINYDLLISDCKRHGLEYLIVRHENISTNPKEAFKYLLHFSGLDCPPTVEKYIESSSTTSVSGIVSPLNTNRLSGEYTREALAQVDIDFQSLISEALGHEALSEELKCYRCNPSDAGY